MAELGRSRRRLHQLTCHVGGQGLSAPQPGAAAVVDARQRCAETPTAASAAAAAEQRPDTAAASAVRCGPGGEMAPQHVEQYVRDGFLLVSGLLPSAVLLAAQDEMWKQMTAENRSAMGGPPLPPRPRALNRHDPTTWTGNWDGLIVNTTILDSYTPAFMRCAEQLRDANAASALFEVADHEITRPPQTVALNRFPVPPQADADAPVTRPSPHTDYGAAGDTGWRSSPQPCVIQSLIYLQAAGRRGAGNTFVPTPG